MGNTRKIPALINIMVFIVIACIEGVNSATFDDAYRLKFDLFVASNYSTSVRPKLNQSEVTDIYLKMFLGMLIELDTREQVMKTSGWFYVSWIDEKLRWNPENYGGIEEINALQKDIWLPDFMATNSIVGHNLLGQDETRVYINSTGSVVWEPGFTFSTICVVDVTMFPMDTQICEILILPWMTSNRYIHVMSLGLDQTKLLAPNFQFDIINASSSYDPRVFSANSATFLPGIIFELTLQRKALFYHISVVGPISTISLLCAVSFLVPPHTGEKVTLSITVLLSVTVFLGVVDDHLPKTSRNVSYFVVYMTMLIMMSFIGVICNIGTLCLFNRDSNAKMPAWLRRFLIRRSLNNKRQRSKKDAYFIDSWKPNIDMNDDDQVVDNEDGVSHNINLWHELARILDISLFFMFIIVLLSVNLTLIGIFF